MTPPTKRLEPPVVVDEKIAFSCEQCDKVVNANRRPSGWSDKSGELLCKQCSRAKVVCRAITIPAAEVVSVRNCRGSEMPELAPEWKDLTPILKEMGREAARVANFVVANCVAADLRTWTKLDGKKFPALKSSDVDEASQSNKSVYLQAREFATTLSPASVSAVKNAAMAKYMAARKDLVIGRAAPPSYRSPAPIPVHNEEWVPVTVSEEDDRPAVEFRSNGRWWRVRLRNGPQFRRQLKDFAMLLDGSAKAGEMAIIQRWETGKTGDENRAGKRLRTMVKMVGWFPRELSHRPDRQMDVRTDAESLWVYHVVGSNDVIRLHSDRARQLVAARDRIVQRQADDMKHHRRSPREVKDRYLEESTPSLRRMRNRFDSFVKESAYGLVSYAQRQRVGLLRYEDTIKTYANFQWFALKHRIEVLCNECGIVFEHVNAEKKPDSARNGKKGVSQ